MHEHNGQTEQLDPDRLMLAVDAIYYAFDEMIAEELPLRHPVDLMGAPDQPACLCDFTRHEVEEASKFLERMGLLVCRERRGGDAGGRAA